MDREKQRQRINILKDDKNDRVSKGHRETQINGGEDK